MSFRKISTSNLASTTTVFDDPIIVINNKGTIDNQDVGILAKTTANAYTGLFRDGTTKDYYLVEQYVQDISNNDLLPGQATLSDLHLAHLTASGITMSGSIIPDTDIAYDLGSPTKQWRDVYVGPGSLYVNGQKVLEDNSGTITVSADPDQSLTIKTSGTGVLTLQSATTINVASTLQLATGVSITSADGGAVKLGDKLDANNNQIINVGTPTLAMHAANKNYVDALFNTIVNGAPGVLDTLNELANAIGDDPNFITTINTSLAAKADTTYVDQQISSITIATDLDSLTDVTLTTPTNGQVLVYDSVNSIWVNSDAPQGFDGQYSSLTGTPVLATVATSGSYADLANKPTLFDGQYSSLTGTPVIPTDVSDLTDTTELLRHFDGDYNSLTNKPTLFSGSYTDLTNKPVLFDGQYSSLTGSPVLATVATSGSYTDLINTPVFPTTISSFTNDTGYLTTETDPIFTASVAAGIIGTDITNWNTAYSWGNHANAGYLTSFTESDPVFTASPAGSITTAQKTNWDTSYSWGDHATAGYLTSYTETDTLASVTSRGNSTVSDIYLNGWTYQDVAGQNLVLKSDTVSRQTLEWRQNTTQHWTLDLTANADLNFVPHTGKNLQISGNRVLTTADSSSFMPSGYSETITSLTHNPTTKVLSYTNESGNTTNIDLTNYIDDTNLARISSGTMDSNGIATFTRDDATTFTVDMSILLDDTNLPRITSASWNTTNGVLTLTRNDATTVTADLDGRYAYSSHTHSYLPLAGGTLTGNLVVEDSEIHVGDTSSDNWTRIKHGNSADYGVSTSHGSASVLVNEQGSLNQFILIGDTDAGGLFAVGQNRNNVWNTRLNLYDNGELYIGASGTSKVWHADNDGSGSGLDSDTVDGLQASQFLRSDVSDTVASTYQFISTSTSPKLDMTGHAGAANYNYFLRAANDTGNKAVHFVNGSTRSADGGPNTYTVRNDGGALRLGKDGYTTFIEGSQVSFSPTADIYMDRANTAGDSIYIKNAASSSWPFKFTTNTSSGDNNWSGFWVNSDGIPDMRLRDLDDDVRVKFEASTSRNSYIDSGNFGIGTRIPSEKLEVNGDVFISGSGSTIAATNTAAGSLKIGGTSALPGLALDSNEIVFGNDAYIGTASAQDINLRTNGANNRVTIKSDGKVGINTVVPSQLLHVAGGAGQWAIFQRGSKQLYINANYSDNNLYSQIGNRGTDNMGLSLSSKDSNPEYLYVATDGKVGMGTLAPDRSLHVHATDARIQITNNSVGKSGTSGIMLGLDSGNANASLWNYNGGYLRFATSNTERIRITDTGATGIGTVSPQSKLHVADTGNTNIRIESTNNNSPYLALFQGGTERAYYQYSNGVGATLQSDISTTFRVDTANKMTLNANGLYVDGGIHQSETHRPDVKWGASGTTTGAILIRLPGTSSQYDMVSIDLDVYEYNSGAGSKIHISGHNWTTGWANDKVQVQGSFSKPIYLTRDGSYYYIQLGDATSTWTYGTVHVTQVTTATFYNIIDWKAGWQISQVTTLPTYTQTSGNMNTGVTLETPETFNAKYITTDNGAKLKGQLVVEDNTGGDGSWNGGILIDNTNATAGEPCLAFASSETGANYWMTGLNQDNNYALTYGTAFQDGLNKFTITPNGQVGINNIPNPTRTLEVNGNGYFYSGVQATGGFEALGGSNVILSTTGTDTGDIVFSDASGEKHRIYDGGTGLQYRYRAGAAKMLYHDGYHPQADNADKLGGKYLASVYRTETSAAASVGPGWVSIATCTSGRRHGEFIVTDAESSDHSFIRIDWMRSYADNNFTVLNVGGHSNRITGVRVLYTTADITYGTAILQVYVTTSSSYTVKMNSLGEHGPGWTNHTIMTPVVQNTITGYAVHGNELTGLDSVSLAAEEGFKCGGSIVAGGDVTAYSDRRFKHDIETISGALDKVNAMRGTSFTMNNKKNVGVIAQEMEEVVPEVVHTDSEGMKSVAYGNLAGVFIEAMKEMDAKYSAKIAELESQIEELKRTK